MIKQYLKNGKTYYQVRVFARSSVNQNLRITKQTGSIENLVMAEKEEIRLKKDCDRELMQIESRGILFGDLLTEWHEHSLKTKVSGGERSLMTQNDYKAGVIKWLKGYLNKPAAEVNALVLYEVFEAMKGSVTIFCAALGEI